MQRVWHQLLRKYRLLSRWQRIGCLFAAMLVIGGAGWAAWTSLTAETPPSISMTALVENARSGEIKSIVWATGFRPVYDWLDVPVVDSKGHLRHDGGVRGV